MQPFERDGVHLHEMFSPLSEKHWDRIKAAHLLNRAGFGGTPDEIGRLVALGPERAVDSLLDAGPDDEFFPPPSMVEPAVRFGFKQREKTAVTEDEKKEIRRQLRDLDRVSMRELRLWWLNRMRYSSSPLREKTTLFWHGHFATSNQKVNDPWMMWVQNETLRLGALGKFPVLLKEMSRDPAMIRWLDLGKSRREHPNENFARELMELFSLGEGHYTEKDIQESARAFTGYRVVPESGAFRFSRKDSDLGEKVFFGETGFLDGDRIIDLITAQPQCARFIGGKLWKFFVSEDPPEEAISGIQRLLYSNGYDICETLRTVFRSEEFYSPKVIHTQIKGPVQWLVQTTRMLGIPLPDAGVIESSMASLGQVLFAPPNVKGWDGGRAWISASSLLYRYNFAAYLLSGKARILGGGGTKVAEIPLGEIAPPGKRGSADALLETLVFRVFNVPLSGKQEGAYLGYLAARPSPYSDSTVLDLIQFMMGTPEYQLN